MSNFIQNQLEVGENDPRYIKRTEKIFVRCIASTIVNVLNIMPKYVLSMNLFLMLSVTKVPFYGA